MSRKSSESIVYKPNPGKQTEFIQATENRILYGGARCGGKSFALAWKAAFQLRSWHYVCGREIYPDRKSIPVGSNKYEVVIDKISIDYPNYVGLLLRRTYPDIVKNLKIECDKLYSLYGAVWKERNHCYIFPSGAMIFLNHCQDEKALRSFIGGNYHFIGIDESNQFPGDWIDKIETSLRTTDSELKPQLCLTANPGDVGHKYLKEKYVDACPPINPRKRVYNAEFDIWYNPQKTGKPYIDDELVHHLFIPALVFDNPILMKNDKAYVRKLKKLPPTLRLMWLEGRWDVFVGMFFDNWDITHIIKNDRFKYGLNFSKETHDIYRFYDYGTKNEFVCIFVALDRDGYLIAFDEIVETGLPASKQAKLVNEYSLDVYKLTPEDITEEIADPAYWTKGSANDDLISPAEYYAEEKIYLIPGNNDRAAGSKILYQAFDIPDTEPRIPRLRLTERCEYGIETIPTIQGDSIDPEKYDTRGADHWVDAARYGCTRILDYLMPKEEKITGWREKLALKHKSLLHSGGFRKSWMSA